MLLRDFAKTHQRASLRPLYCRSFAEYLQHCSAAGKWFNIYRMLWDLRDDMARHALLAAVVRKCRFHGPRAASSLEK
jgi:hypothetical protein